MPAEEKTPVRRIGGTVAKVRHMAIAIGTGDLFASRPNAPESVRLTKRPAAHSAREAEAQAHLPSVLVVGANKGLLTHTVASMAVFGDIFSATDITSALTTLTTAIERKKPIGLVVIDTEIIEGERDWTDIAKAAKDSHAKGVVLFGDLALDLGPRRAFGVKRIVGSDRTGSQLIIALTDVVKKAFPS